MSTDTPSSSPGDRILGLWRRLGGNAAGRWLFSRLLGRVVPYSGTIGARVLEIEPGRAVVAMRDRRRVRNHLRSIHATALITLGELASGLAMTAALPPGSRSIVTGIETRFLKKARGPLTAHGEAPRPEGDERREYAARAALKDASGETVAEITVHWLVGPGGEVR